MGAATPLSRASGVPVLLRRKSAESPSRAPVPTASPARSLPRLRRRAVRSAAVSISVTAGPSIHRTSKKPQPKKTTAFQTVPVTVAACIAISAPSVTASHAAPTAGARMRADARRAASATRVPSTADATTNVTTAMAFSASFAAAAVGPRPRPVMTATSASIPAVTTRPGSHRVVASNSSNAAIGSPSATIPRRCSATTARLVAPPSTAPASSEGRLIHRGGASPARSGQRGVRLPQARPPDATPASNAPEIGGYWPPRRCLGAPLPCHVPRARHRGRFEASKMPSCSSPSRRPSCRCSPSASSDLPAGRGMALRAQVGRLPRARLPRRRRAPASRAATRSRSTATSPSSSPPLQAAAPAALRRSTARSSSPTAAALDFEALQLRLHPAASRVKMLAERDAGVDRLLGPALPGRPRACSATPFRERRALLEAVLAQRRAARSTSRPRPTDRDVAADWFRRFEGAGLDGVMAKPAGGRLRAEQARHVQGEARARVRLRGRPASAGTRAATGTAVGSLLLGLYDDEGVAPARRRVRELHGGEAARARRRSSRPTARTRSRRPPVGRRGPGTADDESADEPQRMPGGKSRWSQGKDLSWEPLRPELVVAGRLRPHAGLALPPHRAVPPVAHRQGAARLHLRPARGRAARTSWRRSSRSARRLDLRRRAPRRHSRVGSSSGSGVSCARARCASGTWRRLTRMRVQVDERPRIESTSTSSTARCAAASGCFAFQRSRPGERRVLVRRVGDDDERHLLARRLRRPALLARATARRAAPRPPSSRSAAARARRRAPTPRRAPRARGAPRATRRRRPCPRADRRCAAKRAGIVSTVKSAGSQSATSSHVSGADTRASGSGRTE